MKTNIHPVWYPTAKVVCACGNTFTVGSTMPEIHTEVCSACHPFFTGEARYVDTAGRVDRFKSRQEAAQSQTKVSKKDKRMLKKQRKIEEELSRPDSLRSVSLKAQ